MEDKILGYKCFNEGLINRYGYKFEIGKIYHANNIIEFRKNGFHMCKNLEDTWRYFDAFNDNIQIAMVIGSGNKSLNNDEYNGFYDMYAVENLLIIHVLSRNEIIAYALNLPEMRLKRFISLFKLTVDEIEIFKDHFYNNSFIIDAISYYQEKKHDVYQKKYRKWSCAKCITFILLKYLFSFLIKGKILDRR